MRRVEVKTRLISLAWRGQIIHVPAGVVGSIAEAQRRTWTVDGGLLDVKRRLDSGLFDVVGVKTRCMSEGNGIDGL